MRLGARLYAVAATITDRTANHADKVEVDIACYDASGTQLRVKDGWGDR
jgi:hypothetical protein